MVTLADVLFVMRAPPPVMTVSVPWVTFTTVARSSTPPTCELSLASLTEITLKWAALKV